MTLFDFESAAEIATYGNKVIRKNTTKLEIAPKFATSGTNALRFTTIKWSRGLPEWPSFDLRPIERDWRGYDRIVLDITNPTSRKHVLSMQVSDDIVRLQEGLKGHFVIPGNTFKRFEVPLSKSPDHLNLSKIARIHLFASRPDADVEIYIDSITLLKSGEKLPEPGGKFVVQLAQNARDQVERMDQELSAAEERIATCYNFPALRPAVERGLAQLRREIEESDNALHAGESLTLAELAEVETRLDKLPLALKRFFSTLQVQRDTLVEGLPLGRMLVGVATSMEQLSPREGPFALRMTRSCQLSLARNERESLQIGVMALDGDLSEVRVKVTDLKEEKTGTLFPATHIECDVMGYVATHPPLYQAPYIGWWPNPILNFLDAVDIAHGELQSFWIRAHATAKQPPGTYRGNLIVTAREVGEIKLALALRVYDFTLPLHSPLPLAITFNPGTHPLPGTAATFTKWRQSPTFPVNLWRKHKERWVDFLADYYITYDNIYHRKMPDFEVVERLRKQRRLVSFNLGYWNHFADNQEARIQWEKGTLQRLRAAYEQARARNLLEYAYIYGCDEVKTEFFPRVEEAASLIKKCCPDVPIISTTCDESYGEERVIQSIDYFCPLSSRFNVRQAALARAKGRQVWWYICCVPRSPYANMFIEYPAIDGRLLMGAMSAKYRPDGFLYYQISIWNSEEPITAGPFTTWPGRSWSTFNGDGAWTCVGPDGLPLPTQRLENFRDGLDDLAYFKLLEATLESQADKRHPWCAAAREALQVPASLVKNLSQYTHDPAHLYAWRNRIALLIEDAPRVKESLLPRSPSTTLWRTHPTLGVYTGIPDTTTTFMCQIGQRPNVRTCDGLIPERHKND